MKVNTYLFINILRFSLLMPAKLLAKVIFPLQFFDRLIKNELELSYRIPFFKKLWLWRNGFLSDSLILYSLNKSNIKEYLSNYSFVKTIGINKQFSFVLNNKLVFSLILDRYEDYKADYYCLITKGMVLPASDKFRLNELNDIINLCKEKKKLVIKPLSMNAGLNVSFFKADCEKLFINNSEITVSKALEFLSTLKNYVVCEYIHQHEYASMIYPEISNSIRIQTMWDYDLQEPFIAIAIQNFGRSTSALPVDNWAQGGLCSLVELEKGILSKAASYPTEPKLVWHEKHPDTNAQIEGILIPHWNNTKLKILEMARSFSFIPYIGWDIIITKEGFKVIEGNNMTGVRFFQIYGPLLKDQRVEKFYKYHKII